MVVSGLAADGELRHPPELARLFRDLRAEVLRFYRLSQRRQRRRLTYRPPTTGESSLKTVRRVEGHDLLQDRKRTRLNSSHANTSYAVFCLKNTKHTIIVYAY